MFSSIMHKIFVSCLKLHRRHLFPKNFLQCIKIIVLGYRRSTKTEIMYALVCIALDLATKYHRAISAEVQAKLLNVAAL